MASGRAGRRTPGRAAAERPRVDGGGGHDQAVGADEGVGAKIKSGRVLQHHNPIGMERAINGRGTGVVDLVEYYRGGGWLVENGRFPGGDVEAVPIEKGGPRRVDLKRVSLRGSVGRAGDDSQSLRVGAASLPRPNHGKTNEEAENLFPSFPHCSLFHVNNIRVCVSGFKAGR